jgi:hypothetical protein
MISSLMLEYVAVNPNQMEVIVVFRTRDASVILRRHVRRVRKTAPIIAKFSDVFSLIVRFLLIFFRFLAGFAQ